MQPQNVFLQTFIPGLVMNNVRACMWFISLNWHGASRAAWLIDWFNLIELKFYGVNCVELWVFLDVWLVEVKTYLRMTQINLSIARLTGVRSFGRQNIWATHQLGSRGHQYPRSAGRGQHRRSASQIVNIIMRTLVLLCQTFSLKCSPWLFNKQHRISV